MDHPVARLGGGQDRLLTVCGGQVFSGGVGGGVVGGGRGGEEGGGGEGEGGVGQWRECWKHSDGCEGGG